MPPPLYSGAIGKFAIGYGGIGLLVSETISQLPTTGARVLMSDAVPVTMGYAGPSTGTTYAVTIAHILSAAGLIHAADPVYNGGVKADGVTDDTTAWSVALSTAFNQGAFVVAPPGTSLVSAITVPNGVAILGRNVGSWSSTVGYPGEGTVIKGTSATDAAITLGQFCQLFGLQIQGPAGQPCVRVSSGYADLFDCTLFGGASGVAYAAVGGASRLLGCRIHDCSTAGVLNPLDVSITGSIISWCGNGIQLGPGCNGVRVTGGKIERCTGYGILADGTGGSLTDLVVSGVQVDGNGRAGVRLRGVSSSAVTGCSLTRNGNGQVSTPASADDASLYLANCNGVMVSGCVSRTGDAGLGYVGPFYGVFDGTGNTNSLITTSAWAFHNNSGTGATAGVINSTATFNLAQTLNATFWS